MKNFFGTILVALALGVSSLFGEVAHAATGPWTWTDISGQLTERSNRPVWATTYAGGAWYVTDGIDLWSGGHVYRYDGVNQTDISLDVRNAGLSRVDDIVGDGTSVWFLKNTTLRNSNFQVLVFNSGYSDITSVLTGVLSSDEGIVQIAGNNGVWAIVTSHGRVLLYTASTRSVRVIRSSFTTGQIPYIQNHDSAGTAVSLQTSVQPLGSGWLLERSDSTGVRFTKIDAYGNLSDLTTDYSMNAVSLFASNGQQVVIGGTRYQGTAFLYTYDGSSFRDVTTFLSGGPSYLADALIEWTGTSWLLVNGKNIYRLTGSSLESYGQTRDYFVTLTGNKNGTVLAGGAVSSEGISQPTSPLTAKLVKVTEGSATASTVTNSDTAVSNGVSVWTWTDPNQTWINRNQTLTFYAGAWDANGIQSIEMYVNGTLRRSCWLGNGMGNQQCSTTLYGGDYSSYQTVTLSAKATDAQGNVVWSQQKNVQATDAYSAVYGNTNSAYDVSAWGALDPSNSTVNRSTSVTYHGQANASAGLSRLDVYANDAIVRTCWFSNQTGNQTCDATIYGSNYSANQSVNVKALATDIYGRTAWSDTRTVTFADSGYTQPNQNTNARSSSWTWSSPDQTALAHDGFVTFYVGAWDADGLQSIDITANGSIVKTCTFTNGYGNQQCGVVLNGSSYTAGSQVYVNARMTDSYGTIFWSDARTYQIGADSRVTHPQRTRPAHRWKR